MPPNSVKFAQELKEAGIQLILSAKESKLLEHDKWLTQQFWKGNGLGLIKLAYSYSRN